LRAIKILVVVCIGLALLPVAVQSRVRDTPHNLHGSNGISVPNQEVCRPCHAPHNASTEIGFLWNHGLSAGGWTLWEGADANSVFSSSSRLCLSCHDGTVAIDTYGGATGTHFMDGRDNLGTNLSNSHPIGVLYPTTASRYTQPDANGAIAEPGITPTGQSAALEEGRVQCSSCHYAHGSRATYGMFLRVDNTGSQLCMTCHKAPG
jgi:predicted CXXCH cytochrome family protein